MIKEDVNDENNELRDYVDDMVLFKGGDTEEEAISGLYKDLMEAKNKLTEIGQVLNDTKEHMCVQSKTGENLASNLPRLQRQSRTSSHLSRNHSENTQ
eukprot:11003519-Heterocapsa_arctica.AAC.1